MDQLYDYKQFAILYVDDEEMALKYFTKAFADQFRIYTASNAREGLKILEEHQDEIGLLMTDQKMPGEKGIWLLEQARRLSPRMVRILVTAFSEMEVAIAAVNTGAIYKYITKPWDPPQLENTLKRGLEFFLVQRERDILLQQKLSVLHNMMIADRLVSLGLLAAGLSHHIRNALVAVKTFLDLAPAKLQEEKVDARDLRNPEFWKEYYQNVQSQISRINNLLKDLWVASEKPDLAFSDRVRLRDVIESALDQLKGSLAERNIRVENQIAESLPQLSVDRGKFYRLFELLLKDEIASLPAGSAITFSADVARNGHSHTGREEVHIRVSDNGPGLPKDALRLVFDPFLVRSDSPMEYGIHLMACFFIVHHHGGRIEAQSQEGGGTTFSISLPTNPSQIQTAQTEQEFMQKALLSESLWQKLIAT